MFDFSGEKATVQSQQMELLAHPAVRAWCRLGPERPVPTRVGPAQFKRHAKTTNVYRLEDAAPGGGAVIAKRCRPARGAVERIVYEHYLPHLPVPVAGYLGYLEDPADERTWLFMRAVAGERYAHDDPAHRAYAGRWIGALHARAQAIGPHPGLPAADPRRYLEHLRHARELIHAHRHNPVFVAEDLTLLDALSWHFDEI